MEGGVVVALNEFEEVANNFLEVSSKEELKLVCSLLKINSELSLNPSSW